MDSKSVNQIFQRFKQQNPKPTTELQFSTPFELLIAVVLSAQATDVSVNKATKILFLEANTPETILKLGGSNLKKYIKTIGLYNTKAKNIMKLCQQLLDQHNGVVPNDRNSLEALAGVGRKTANVILNTLFGESTIAVDTHIFRVARRIGLTKGKTPLAVETDLLAAIPKKYLHDTHHWLVLHGRYICVARKPRCYQCIINDVCEYPDKNFESC